MKLNYIKKVLHLYVIVLTIPLVFISCGTAQTVTGSDGIYNDQLETTPTALPPKKEIVNYQKTYNNNNKKKNSFTKEVERLGLLNGTDIFTDIESYRSINSEELAPEDYNEAKELETRTYNSNTPWGYDSRNNDVVINVNTSPFWGNYNYYGWNNWNYGWNNWNYGWNRFNPWWRGGFWYGSTWGWNYNRYYNPYYYPYNRYYGSSYYRRGANPYRPVVSRRNYYDIKNYNARRTITSKRYSNNVYRNARSTYNGRVRNTRGYNSSPTRSYTPSRSRSGSSRNYNSSPTRSYTPSRSRSSSSRNYNSSGYGTYKNYTTPSRSYGSSYGSYSSGSRSVRSRR